MDRRKALKNMGLSLGYAVATPTLISIVQSCKEKNVLDWTPDFFTKEEGSVLTHLVDIILPKTDTPSASEVQVHLFIDKFVDQTMYGDKEYVSHAETMGIKEDNEGHLRAHNRDLLKRNMGRFIAKVLNDSNKEDAADLTAEDLKPVFASALQVDKAKEDANEKEFKAYAIAFRKGGAPQLSDEISIHAFASNIRDLTIWGYKTSEYIGEEVLAYLPVPGEYIGCGDVQELTGGKAWSL